jgi:hypothetical protein
MQASENLHTCGLLHRSKMRDQPGLQLCIPPGGTQRDLGIFRSLIATQFWCTLKLPPAWAHPEGTLRSQQAYQTEKLHNTRREAMQ